MSQQTSVVGRTNPWSPLSGRTDEQPVALERVRYAAALKPLMALEEDVAILVVGCGGGRALRVLEGLGYQNVTCVDRDAGRLERARRAGGTSATLVCGDVESLEDASFDGAVSVDGSADPAALARVVRPGGIVSITSKAYAWRWLAKLGLTGATVADAAWPATRVEAARAAGLTVAGYGPVVNVPAQRWYFARQVARAVNPGRWVGRLVGAEQPYEAYEHLDEVTRVESAIDEMPLDPGEKLWTTAFSYESYYWFKKPGGDAVTVVGKPTEQVRERYRAAA